MSTQIILTSDIEHVGQEGDTVLVADGYARNYLIPQKLAIVATPGNLRRVEKLRAQRAAELTAKIDEAKALAKKIEKATCTVSAPVGADGKLFGSVTASDIVEELKKAGLEIERKRLVMEHPLRAVGQFEIPVKLHAEVTATLKVAVVSSAIAAAESAGGK